MSAAPILRPSLPNWCCALANVFHEQIVPHNTKPTLATAATVPLMASNPHAGPFIDYILDLLPTVTAMLDQDIRFAEGY